MNRGMGKNAYGWSHTARMRPQSSLGSIDGFAVARAFVCLALVSVLGLALSSFAGGKNAPDLQRGAVVGADQPIEITARRLAMKFGKGKAQATYENNVKVRQGDVTMSCDRLVIDYDTKEIESGQEKRDPKLTKDVALSNLKTITATGNAKIVQGDRMATCGKALFDNKKRTIELTDSPRVWQGPDSVDGKKIVFYIDEDRLEVDGEVKTRISPGTPKKEQEK